jgi:hypothetical protein
MEETWTLIHRIHSPWTSRRSCHRPDDAINRSIVSFVNQCPTRPRVASRVALCFEKGRGGPVAGDRGEKSRTILGEGWI